ncbi:hypothetical protein COU61_00720, partial [Candidatus Pacearchaeota archaeon CG10_big_fil_rev_8_21_14_0_10_35_13]
MVTMGGYASALNTNFTIAGSDGAYLNLANNNTINITVGAVEGNITNITFTYSIATSGSPTDLYINNSNGSSLTNILFYDRTAYPGAGTRYYNLTFNNNSGGTLIVNGTSQSFWFDVAVRNIFMGEGALLGLTVNASNSSGYGNVTTINFYPSFTFTGYIVNETGCATCWQNNTNVTIYGVTMQPNSPPTSTLLARAQTNNSGFFRLNYVNASASFNGFKLKTIYYNASGRATKVGMNMPEFPSFLYYGGMGGIGKEGENFDMSLNGATFYLQEATTINITAHNGSLMQKFGYELIDQALGFPIESQSTTSVISGEVVVPANRGYVVSFFRMPAFPGSSVGFTMDPSVCVDNFMNDTYCPAPPRSYAINAANATAGNVTTINQSLMMTRVNVYGCITPNTGANNSAINITSILIKMLPWTTDAGSFVPPNDADDGTINVTNDINYTATNLGCTYASYNLSLLNDTGYMIEFYAKNGTNESSNPGNANNLAGFINFTSDDELYENANTNVTMYRLAGNYMTNNISGLKVNTSIMKFNIINS